MRTHRTFRMSLALALVSFLTPSVVSTQSKLKEPTMEALANKAMLQYLKTPYKGNGRSISGAGISSWLTKNKLTLSKLPPDIGGDISRSNVDGLLIPDVTNPVRPGTTGEVVLVRSRCQLTTEGCSHRGFLIQPLPFFGSASEDDLCEHCTGCEGKVPPNCDTYDICVCTQGKCPRTPCKKCTGC